MKEIWEEKDGASKTRMKLIIATFRLARTLV